MGIGFFELLIIISIALVVLKQEDWLRLAFRLGKISHKINKFKNDLKKTYKPFLEDLELKEIEKKARERVQRKEPFC